MDKAGTIWWRGMRDGSNRRRGVAGILDFWCVMVAFDWLAGISAFAHIYSMNFGKGKKRASEQDYFAYEESIEGRAEYFNGEIFDMSGGSEFHSSISQNLAREIGVRLGKGPCRVHGADLRLRIDLADAFVRPDVWVICEKTDYHKGRTDTARNATFVAEVQSESTTLFDHYGKFDRYWMVPGLQEYVMVEQHTPQVDVFFRNAQGTLEFSRVTDLTGEVFFQSLGFAVPMEDIYRHVEFEGES
jgi:Uma2 family endonuclease